MDNRPLKDIVYQTLRNDILSGKIPGGSHITESSISKQLDVSRTPVREALQRLTQERLITALPRAGYIIEDMSDEDIQDIFSARFEIEALVIKRAVKYITPDELKALADNIDQARAHISTGGHKKVTLLDLEFHDIIYRASRSKTFYRICKDLGDLTMKYRHGLNLEEDLWGAAIENHQTILQALGSGDEDKAVQAIISHGEQAKARLIDVMKKARSELFKG
jgi:DNA-binding GntR family transcriptional regulator